MSSVVYESNAKLSIRAPKAYLWHPKPDITAYELALCVPLLMAGLYDVESVINRMPHSAARHFEEA